MFPFELDFAQTDQVMVFCGQTRQVEVSLILLPGALIPLITVLRSMRCSSFSVSRLRSQAVDAHVHGNETKLWNQKGTCSALFNPLIESFPIMSKTFIRIRFWTEHREVASGKCVSFAFPTFAFGGLTIVGRACAWMAWSFLAECQRFVLLTQRLAMFGTKRMALIEIKLRRTFALSHFLSLRLDHRFTLLP